MRNEAEYTVKEFMAKDIVEATPGTTVMNCAQVMAAEHVSSILVLGDNRLVGILTEKDIARKVVAKGLDPKATMVGDVMTKDLVAIEPDTTLYDAMITLNRSKIKHLPVVKDNVVVGIITAMDILKVQPALIDIFATPRTKLPEED